jgi:hypothetical protein
MSRYVSRRAVAAFALLAGVAAAGCRKEEPRRELPPAAIDTTNKSWEDGVSGAQVQEEVVPMSPEEAQARGLVDTTTHLENLGADDSAAAAADTAVARRGGSRADTARGGTAKPAAPGRP